MTYGSSKVPGSDRRRSLVIGSALIGAMTLAGCSVANSDGDDSADGSTTTDDVVRIVVPQEPPTLEACDSSLTATGSVVRSNITEPLIERDARTGELEPKLATEWEAESDTSWVLTLRDDVTFHDGSAFDAESAAVSIQRVVDGQVGCDVDGAMFGNTELTTEVVDDTTLRVTSETPDPTLPLRLSFIEVVPGSTSITEKVREPIGTGPYQLTDWTTTEIRVETFADYWGDAPEFAAAEYMWRGEGTIRAAMVSQGEADVATQLGPNDGAGEYAVDFETPETIGLRIDGTEGPLQDIRVRQAVDHAIDRQGLIDSVFDGLATPATQLVIEGTLGYNPDIEPTEYDLDTARALVEEAAADGVPVDETITLIGRTARFPGVDQYMEVVQNSLTEVGLNAEIQMLESAAFLEYQVRPFPEDDGAVLLLVAHGNQAGDAAFSLQYLRSDAELSTFGTEELDALIDQAVVASDGERQDLFAEVFATEKEEVRQYHYTAHLSGIIALSDRVDYEPDSASYDELRLAEMTKAG